MGRKQGSIQNLKVLQPVNPDFPLGKMWLNGKFTIISTDNIDCFMANLMWLQSWVTGVSQNLKFHWDIKKSWQLALWWSLSRRAFSREAKQQGLTLWKKICWYWSHFILEGTKCHLCCSSMSLSVWWTVFVLLALLSSTWKQTKHLSTNTLTRVWHMQHPVFLIHFSSGYPPYVGVFSILFNCEWGTVSHLTNSMEA